MFCHKFKLSKAQVRTDYLGMVFARRNRSGSFQLVKTIAKLRLLDAGLLVAAKLVDDMHLKSKQSDEDEDGDGTAVEDIDDFAMRVELWVQNHLRSAASSSKRDSYKDGLVYQERKDVVHEFLKSTQRKKCGNPSCGA